MFYEALDRDRCLVIFEGYRVGSWDHHILRHYWYRLNMVDFTGGYYGVLLQDFRGVTLGYQLLPTISNNVVDIVVRNWVSLVEGCVTEPDGKGRELLHSATFFYTQDGLVASTDPEWLQGVFNTLARLSNRLGVHTNVSKIDRMF